ncbi:MAG: hypothetical protein EOP11_10360 [Proteobacteria bacterium]|nr:MAG: hypothetical protein EOP11_10360 [Pseudomonadota bacterium]
MKIAAFVAACLGLILFVLFYVKPNPMSSGSAHFPAPNSGQGSSNPGAPGAAPSSGNAALSAAPSASPIAQAIQADDACEIARLLGQLDITKQTQAASVLAVVGAPPALQEVFSAEGPLVADAATPLEKFEHPLSKMLFALRLGGSYPGGPQTKEDLAKASALLTQLENEDAGNAAIPFFLLEIEKRRGASPAKLRAIAARAAKGTRFETYVSEAQRSLQSARFLNTAQFGAVETLLQNLDSANLQSPANALKAADKSAGTNYSAAVANLMQAEGKAARRGLFFYDYSEREFDVGRMLNGNRGPDAQALSRKKEGLPKDFRYPNGVTLEEDGSCDDAAAREDFRRLANLT